MKRYIQIAVVCFCLATVPALAESEQERYQRHLNEKVFGVGGQNAEPEAQPDLRPSAESEQERYQRHLNEQVFGIGGQSAEPEAQPDLRPTPEPVPKPVVAEPVPKPVVAEPPPTVNPSPGPSETIFSDYRLEGLGLGMDKADVLASLQSNGFACNLQQFRQMQQMMGVVMCIKGTMMTAPKIVSLSFSGNVLTGFEMREQYETAFPEKIYARTREKFMAQYGEMVACKKQRRGEICELFGDRYRIVLKAELKEDEAEITSGIHPL